MASHIEELDHSNEGDANSSTTEWLVSKEGEVRGLGVDEGFAVLGEHEHDHNGTRAPSTMEWLASKGVEVRDLGLDKGFAAFALRKFEKGDLILTEKPTTWVHGHHPFDSTQVAEIEEKVGALSEEDRRAFYDMSNVFPEAATKATGIFMTNCFDMTNAPHGESCAMYIAIARLNHSCTPNAQQTHIPETGEEVLYASRTIEIGEEINDCYIDLRQSTSMRKKDLLEYYRFECTCSACTLCDARDDAKRTRAQELDERIMDAIAEDGPEMALEIAKDALRLLLTDDNSNSNGEEEQQGPCCLRWSARFIPDAHSTVSQLAAAVGSTALARTHAQKAYDELLLLQGPRSPDTKAAASKRGVKSKKSKTL